MGNRMENGLDQSRSLKEMDVEYSKAKKKLRVLERKIAKLEDQHATLKVPEGEDG